jgi:YHS domain-containing protein
VAVCWSLTLSSVGGGGAHLDRVRQRYFCVLRCGLLVKISLSKNSCKEFFSAATNKRMKQLSTLLLALGLALSASAQTKTLLNLDKEGVAIQGYDPVAFFTQNAPVKGRLELTSQYNGATYRFASKKDKELFDKDSARYEPIFGGYCAFGVSKNKLVPIDVEAFQIIDGKLVLQYSKSVQENFNKDTKGNLTKATQNWPGLVDKNGK